MDLSFMDVNLDEAVELETLPDGTEAQLEIRAVDPNDEKNYCRLTCGVLNHGMVKTISHFLFFPKDDDTNEKKNNKLLGLRTFFNAIGVSVSEFVANPDCLVGMTYWAILREEDSDEYGKQNSVKRVATPK